MIGFVHRLVVRIGWGVGDQAFSSLTNVAVAIVIARETDAHDFGAFSLAFATYIIVMNVCRALATEPLVVRYSAAEPAKVAEGARATTGTSLSLGLVAAVGSGIVALASHGSVRGAFAGLALTFPGLMVQDAWRFSFFAWARGRDAFVNDVVWAVVMFPVFGLMELTETETVFTLTLAWGGSATVAAVVGALQARARPAPARTVAWLREHRDLSPHFLGELMALSGARQGVLYGVGAISGLAATGSLRGAQILVNPINILTQGIRLMVVPDNVRALKTSSPDDGARRVLRTGVTLACVLASIAMLIGLVGVLLPASIGVQILGKTWATAHALILPTALATAGGGIVAGASVGLRALAAARESRNARTVLSALQVAGGLVGAWVAGATGAAWGLAAANLGGSVQWWWRLRDVLNDYRARPVVREEPEPIVPVVSD